LQMHCRHFICNTSLATLFDWCGQGFQFFFCIYTSSFPYGKLQFPALETPVSSV
jgi:hypothetical protein